MPVSMSIAPNPPETEQTRLLRPASLGLFLVVVVAVVFGVAWQYGWHGLHAFQESAADARAQLQGAALMLRSGQYQAAEKQIAPLLADPRNPLYREGRWMQWQIAKTKTLALPPNSVARKRAVEHLQPVLLGLMHLGGWSASQWRELAQDAAAVGAYEISARAWLAAARIDPQSTEDSRNAAAALAAGGQAAKAGQILLNLVASAPNSAAQKQLFFQGAQWLEGGAGAALALARCREVLRQQPPLWQDRQIVLFMSRLAMAAGRPELAAQWLHAQLEHKPIGEKGR